MGSCSSLQNKNVSHTTSTRPNEQQSDAKGDTFEQKDQSRVSAAKAPEKSDQDYQLQREEQEDKKDESAKSKSDEADNKSISKPKTPVVVINKPEQKVNIVENSSTNKHYEANTKPVPAEVNPKIVVKKDVQAPQPQTKTQGQVTSQDDENSSKLSKRMTRDTYDYLLQFVKTLPEDNKGRHVPSTLARCLEGDYLLLLPSSHYWIACCTALSDIVETCFTKMCAAKKREEKTQWRTRMFNVIEAIYLTRSGEQAFGSIQRAAKSLKKNYPVTEDGKAQKVNVDIIDFDDVSAKNLSLTSFFPFEAKDLTYNKEDSHFEFQQGEGLAILTERKAVKKVLQRAKELKEEYTKTIGNILTSHGGEHFKCGSKSYLRTEAKLNELAAEQKERPVFKHLFDSLRCKAHFMDPNDLKKAYDAISGQFQVLRLKNKLNTHLKNMTLNLVYKDIVSEVQLVLGESQAESENHILYEIERTRSIAELYEVVEGWGGFDYSTFEPLKGDVVEINKPDISEKWVTMGDTRYKLIRSKEYVAETSRYDPTTITYFDESSYFNNKEEKLKIRYPGQCFYVSACSDFPTPKNPVYPDALQAPVKTQLLKDKDDAICKVEGFKDTGNWKIEGLKIHTRKGQVISLGTVGEKASFTFKAPDDARIVAFGGRMHLNNQYLLGLYCWIVADEEKIKTGYQGEMQNGVQQGKGVMVYPDGSRYTGEWKNNKKNGKGVLIDAKGDIIYEGEWVDDKRDGQGRYNYSPQEWYNGNWKNDKRDGIGQYSCAQEGLHYYGMWKSDKLNGNGIIVSPLGECKGLWEDNYCKNGKVVSAGGSSFVYSGGLFCDIETKKLLPHGHGVGVGLSGSFVVGEWQHGKGEGKLIDTGELITTGKEASRYEGELNAFNPTENGTWYYLGGAKIEGKIDSLAGGKCYHTDGAIIEGASCEPTNWILHFPAESKAIGIKLNTQLFAERAEESYYHAPTSTLYYVLSAVRFVGKKVNFKTDNGQGTWYLLSGRKLTGSWKVEDKQFDFEGTIDYPSGNTFEGTFKAYVGPIERIELLKGTLTYKNGAKFEGKWDGDYLKEGTLTYSNGDKYIGSWRAYYMDKGEFQLSNGEKLIKSSGTMKYKVSDHKVITFGSEGERFELDWDMKSDKEEKIVKGTCFYRNGDRYEGEIRTPCTVLGKGVLYYANGDRFEGVWYDKNGSKRGEYFNSNAKLVLKQEWDARTLISCNLAKNI